MLRCGAGTSGVGRNSPIFIVRSRFEGSFGETPASMALLDIFRPKWKRSNAAVRLAAVDDLNDQEILGKIAQTDGDSRVKCAAVRKLTDQRALSAILRTDSDSAVRKAAIETLTDETVLAEVATTDNSADIRKFTTEHLTDPAVLAQVVMTDIDGFVRQAAVERLSDQKALAAVAANNNSRDICRAAVRKLTDQTALAQVAKTANNGEIRKMAVEKLSDEGVIADVARSAFDGAIRKIAVENLTDQATLGSIAKTDKEQQVCLAAIVRLTDPLWLAQIAKSGCDAYVRNVAAKKLPDQGRSPNITKSKRDRVIRSAKIVVPPPLFTTPVPPNLSPALNPIGQGASNQSEAVDKSKLIQTSVATVIGCPACNQRLRVPIDRGNLELTCPQCRHNWRWSKDLDRYNGQNVKTNIPIQEKTDFGSRDFSARTRHKTEPLRDYILKLHKELTEIGRQSAPHSIPSTPPAKSNTPFPDLDALEAEMERLLAKDERQ